MRSIVYPYPDHDAGEINIWTRNVDWYDIRLIRSILKPGDFIVDAGCNVGNRTLAIADLIDGALLIDAGRRALERTLKNRRLNGLSTEKFIVLHKAVGNHAGTVSFSDLGGASTQNRIVDAGSTGVTMVEVPLTTIDIELEWLGKRPAFIKVDVEGHDYQVLEGALA